MVTVTGYNERQRKDGTTFIALEINSGVELIQSNTTGRYFERIGLILYFQLINN